MGAAATVPVAAALPIVGAVGCLWFGAAGGALPDYLDLKSDARHALKHRGVSHSALTVALATLFTWFVLSALSRSGLEIPSVPERYVLPWSLSLCLGMVSHLLGDACTRGGIRPLLPILRT